MDDCIVVEGHGMIIIERRFAIVFVLAMCILVVGCSKKKDDETEAVEQHVLPVPGTKFTYCSL